MRNKWIVCWAFFITVFFIGTNVYASEDVGELKSQLQEMNQQIKRLQKKINTLEKENIDDREEIEYIGDRLDKAELHTATDKISLGIEFRTKAESLHYDDMRAAPAALLGGIFAPVAAGGFNGAALNQIRQGMQNMIGAGMVPPLEKYDEDNDVIFTNKFLLNMKAKINNRLNFAGRLAAYKVWGDSTGAKFYQGSMSDVTFDGNTSSLPHGDTIHLERAYFVYSMDNDYIPVSLSIGRRPSTEGPPLEYSNYSLEGGTPLATIINWQFDGASLTFGLEDLSGIPGASIKLCYGVGFEGDWGNSYTLNNSEAEVDDVNLAGVVATLFDNGDTSAVLNYAHAWDITDGFTGLTVMPFVPYTADRDGDGIKEYYFDTNQAGYITRMQPTTEIGDWDAATLLVRQNLYANIEKDVDLFLACSWSRTDPSKISENPYYEMFGQGLLSSNGKLEDRDGYSLFIGATFPMPYNAKLGLEYNWGSKYWFNFTGAEDSLIGSKLAVRGSVYEGYYIQPLVSSNFFIKLGAIYYNYKYTGSGNPMGAPVRISGLTSLDALNPVVDKVWNGYVSANLRF